MYLKAILSNSDGKMRKQGVKLGFVLWILL